MTEKELKKAAEQKLSEARKLLKEAGKLAEQGGFTLQFNSDGTYIPKSIFKDKAYREEALTQAKRDFPNWKELSEHEWTEIVEDYTRDARRDVIPYTYYEAYGDDPSGAGDWWMPSTC